MRPVSVVVTTATANEEDQYAEMDQIERLRGDSYAPNFCPVTVAPPSATLSEATYPDASPDPYEILKASDEFENVLEAEGSYFVIPVQAVPPHSVPATQRSEDPVSRMRSNCKRSRLKSGYDSGGRQVGSGEDWDVPSELVFRR